MSATKFRDRVGPIKMALALRSVANHCEEEGDEEGLAVVDQIRSSRDMREAFRDELAGMMSASQFAAAPKADGEFLKWLIQFIIENLPAIIALFAV